LIERGAAVDLVDDRGRSALMIAAQREHGEIAALLIERGANTGLTDHQGKTAMELAGNEALRQTLQTTVRK